MECSWQLVGLLDESDCDFGQYYTDIGVYQAELDGVTAYIGKATELDNGGFRKRFRDYTRASNSARNYPGGHKMHDHKHQLNISICCFPRNYRSVQLIEALEARLIEKHKPILCLQITLSLGIVR